MKADCGKMLTETFFINKRTQNESKNEKAHLFLHCGARMRDDEYRATQVFSVIVF